MQAVAQYRGAGDGRLQGRTQNAMFGKPERPTRRLAQARSTACPVDQTARQEHVGAGQAGRQPQVATGVRAHVSLLAASLLVFASAACGTTKTATCDPSTGGCSAGSSDTKQAACSTSTDCATGHCDPVSFTCVACLKNGDCTTAGTVCFAGSCAAGTACSSTVACKASGQVCDAATEHCVDCLVEGDCGAGKACLAQKCVAKAACASDKDCPIVCGKEIGICVQCNVSADCASGSWCSDDHSCHAATCTAGACSSTGWLLCKPDGSGYQAAVNCDDKNACTTDSCDAVKGCVHDNTSDGSVCDDDNACTAGDACAGGTCTVGAKPADCDDKNLCTTDSCDKAKGCLHAPLADGAACDDDNACTTEACADGSCAATDSTSSCSDGNVCTQNDACASGKCVGGPTQKCDDGNPCTDDGCDKIKGCQSANNTLPCSDDDACTLEDACSGGVCNPGSKPICDDDNQCTVDGCDPQSGCSHTAVKDGGACDLDGNKCTQDLCMTQVCKASPPSDCDDDNSCTTDGCNPKSGLCAHVTLADGSPCQDGDVCTVGDGCQSGACKAGALDTCDDGNQCTVDACDPFGGCGHTSAPNGSACDPDASKCTNDVCDAGVCNAVAPNLCDDKNACTTDSCVAKTGACIYVKLSDGGACSDGNACTIGDACQAGACEGGPPAGCDDANQCTTDACDPIGGCSHTANVDGSTCELDGNKCTLDVCTAGICSSSKTVDCDDKNVCTTDSCTSNSGLCVHAVASGGTACDDGNPCTTADVCAGAVCVGGAALNCDDGNVCTSDSCQAGLCVHATTTGGCDLDASACTPDVCVVGLCAAVAAVNCDDVDPCTTDSCDAATGACGHVGLSAGPSCLGAGINVVVKSVTTMAADPIKVHFSLKDDKGYLIDVCGKYSQNNVIQPRFGLAFVSQDAAGNALPYTVLTNTASSDGPTVANPTVLSPLGSDCLPAVDAAGVSTGAGTLVDDGAGDYTYTFPTADTASGPFKVAYDPAKLGQTHVLWIQVQRQTDLVATDSPATFKASNFEFDFIPSGKGTVVRRELVATATCNNCHRGFRPEGKVSTAFHGGGMVEAPYCNFCHNSLKTAVGAANEAADSMVFIHRMHNSQDINQANLFHGIKFPFPQDIRNCKSCHAASLQPDQWKTHPSRKACGSCHDYVDFATTTLSKCATPPALDQYGVKMPCQHNGGVQTSDANCGTSCHTADLVAAHHLPVATPDPNNILSVPSSGNDSTNAAYVASAGLVPPGADVITYDLKEVGTWFDGKARHPYLTFKLKRNGTAVVFPVPSATVTEMIPNFVGSPSLHFVWALPQDGIAMPADFNASGSAYLKDVWNGTPVNVTSGTFTFGTKAGVTCSVAAPCTCAPSPNSCLIPQGTLTFGAASGYYTVKLIIPAIAATATMLTGGVGYSYGLTATQPLTQTNVLGYPYNVATKVGGIVVPAANVKLPAKNTAVATGTATTGFQGTQLCGQVPCTCTTAAPCNAWAKRRDIVDNTACLKCHSQLGAGPIFHAGQANNGESCIWCHNPNRTSSAWSSNSKDFVHALHGGRMRSVPFNWQALKPLVNFASIKFPGPLSDCSACHVTGAFDYSGTAAIAALPNMLMSTVAVGKFDGSQATNPSGYFAISPYVAADNLASYGAGFAVDTPTGASMEATGATAIITPMTAACSGCHDGAPSIDHMKANGGRFYDSRANAMASGAAKEQCLTCHGPGSISAIAKVHQ